MAAKKKNKDKTPSSTIALNRKARHEYTIEDRLEAGMVLEGWEVKSMRAGRASLQEAYCVLRNGEAWLLGANFTPAPGTSTHVNPDPRRTRKLLLHQHELSKLIGLTEQRGYTLIPLAMYWKRGRAKLEIGVAKGKKKQDKRADEKKKDWQRQKARILKSQNM
ncbi:SsrA-binding protein SmpB [Natronospira bacteriovora]|uniref:SsrA-binding protein n=1 Tax=Natronospira bacteriovora TaxID=3069753 RepID=A0ABU0W554_9GAMM|nr:SsrA-binding protein SmpB [Natronospira sp. AB-CW4]MDQ2069107.1 SsrA-binding protein SmpB [Natronospira sp. AB-CW4]